CFNPQEISCPIEDCPAREQVGKGNINIQVTDEIAKKQVRIIRMVANRLQRSGVHVLCRSRFIGVRSESAFWFSGARAVLWWRHGGSLNKAFGCFPSRIRRRLRRLEGCGRRPRRLSEAGTRGILDGRCPARRNAADRVGRRRATAGASAWPFS